MTKDIPNLNERLLSRQIIIFNIWYINNFSKYFSLYFLCWFSPINYIIAKYISLVSFGCFYLCYQADFGIWKWKWKNFLWIFIICWRKNIFRSIGYFLLFIFVSLLNIDDLVSKIVIWVIVIIVNYLLNRDIVFK